MDEKPPGQTNVSARKLAALEPGSEEHVVKAGQHDEHDNLPGSRRRARVVSRRLPGCRSVCEIHTLFIRCVANGVSLEVGMLLVALSICCGSGSVKEVERFVYHRADTQTAVSERRVPRPRGLHKGLVTSVRVRFTEHAHVSGQPSVRG